jgi:hypothetical protein
MRPTLSCTSLLITSLIFTVFLSNERGGFYFLLFNAPSAGFAVPGSSSMFHCMRMWCRPSDSHPRNCVSGKFLLQTARTLTLYALQLLQLLHQPFASFQPRQRP